MYKNHIQSALAVSLGVATFASTLPAAHAQTKAAGLEEVFVTARKRDEGVQAVPISIAALSAETLAQRGVQEIQDLNSVVPGFRFSSQGGKGNTELVLRGLTKIPIGEGVASVVTYFGNVALPSRGGNIPTFDIANIQVLKGPQGTLFGRNTLGGAVVITPEAPNYTLGGYVKGNYGSKDYRNFEGAVNTPIVDDKVALRIAGQVRRQDGMTKNLGSGPDLNNIHQNSYRISLLLNPADNIESTTVFDHMQADERSSGAHLFKVNSGFFSGPRAGLGAVLLPQLNAYLAQTSAADVNSAFTSVPDGGFIKRKLWGASNDTAWETDFATVRNILGYRRVTSDEANGSDGVGPLTVGPVTTWSVLNGYKLTDREYLTDEFQVFGNAMDDRLDWIVGAFYNKDESHGPQGTRSKAFSGTVGGANTGHEANTNKALFGQTGLDLSEWLLDGLKLNTGLRYSWDRVTSCGGINPANTQEFMSESECEEIAGTGLPDGIGVSKNKGKEASWTIGLDWQMSPDTLVYLANRRGYRGVNVNTPTFETQFTTGGTGCAIGATPVPCPDLSALQKTDAETLTDFELGVKSDWSIGDVRGRVNAAAYISKYKNALQFINAQTIGIPLGTPDAPSLGTIGVNAADLTIQGLELDVTIVPTPSLTFTLSGAYTDQKVDKVTLPTSVSPGLNLTESQITLPSPQFSGSFGFNWTLPIQPLDGELALNGDYYHTDDFGGQGGINLPGYEVANFRLSWNGIAGSSLNLAAYVKNAFDEEYYIAPVVLLPTFPTNTANPGDPRTWGVEASYRF